LFLAYICFLWNRYHWTAIYCQYKDIIRVLKNKMQFGLRVAFIWFCVQQNKGAFFCKLDTREGSLLTSAHHFEPKQVCLSYSDWSKKVELWSKFQIAGWEFTKLSKFVRFFVTLGLKILRLFRLKVLFKQISLKSDVNYCINHKVPIFYE